MNAAGADATTLVQALRELADEDPLLGVAWYEQLQEVHVQLMGEVQREVVARQLLGSLWAPEATFGAGGILYRETVTAPVRGAGHFEPLRHYAEVQLLVEPSERGAGVEAGTRALEDDLDRNWQRLILTHVLEREHPGVLTGAPLTDARITLLGGRAHLKHTEGGDFRQATYRARSSSGTTWRHVNRGLASCWNRGTAVDWAFRRTRWVARLLICNVWAPISMRRSPRVTARGIRRAPALLRLAPMRWR